MKSSKQSAAFPPASGSSFISNTFAFSIHLKDLLEMLVFAQNLLKGTNQTLEKMYPKPRLSTVTLTLDQFLDLVWYNDKGERQSNRALLYSIYGYNQALPIKAGISKRSELIGHLNIMAMGLTQKLKESVFDDSIYFTTEEDLFAALLKVFHSKLFESPVFRKVRHFFKYSLNTK